ncbi:predicted protein, partial [Nematostella vectensis]
GRFDLTVGPKQTMGKTIESVVVNVPFPKQVLNVNLTPSVGTYSFDPSRFILICDIDNKLLIFICNPKRSVTVLSRFLHLQVEFKIPQLASSGIKVSRLDLYGEKYKPFKGVKYITKAGRFQVRT